MVDGFLASKIQALRKHEFQHILDIQTLWDSGIRCPTVRYDTIRHIYVRSTANEMASLV